MTLIEVLLTYREAVKRMGRLEADNNVLDMVDPFLWDDIRNTVSDTGEFVDTKGNIIQVEDHDA